MKNFVFLFVAISLLSVISFVSAHPSNNTLVLAVDVDEASFDIVSADVGTAVSFNIVGEFEGGGTFRCWGWIDADGVGSVSQVYDIPGRGKIMTQGIEGDFLAVTGGTGDFRKLQGEALQVFTGPGFDFTIEFDVKRARK